MFLLTHFTSDPTKFHPKPGLSLYPTFLGLSYVFYCLFQDT